MSHSSPTEHLDSLISGGHTSQDRMENSIPSPAVIELVRDIRYGIRTLFHNPVLSLTAVATMGLGIPAVRVTRVNLVDAFRVE